MKNIILLGFLFVFSFSLFSQEKTEIYNTAIDGMKQLDEAVVKASKEKKYLLIQVGGNWCPWCIRFNKFLADVPQVDSIMKSSFILVHLNYSRENRNYPALARLGYPQRFGFPVLVVINGKGERLHTQDSGFLEKDKGYDTLKVVTFLKNWTPNALNPENYKPIDESKSKH
jgi:thioredoxin-related protein